MSEKKNALFTIGILCAIILAFTIADFWESDRVFSEQENRVLASKPEFSMESLKNGSYTTDYEEYVTDQFVSRDKWITLKTETDILFQKKDINGIYLGKDGYLIEQHMPQDYTKVQEVKKAAALKKLVQKWNAKVMLVPTADNILTDKLPDNAVYYDESRLLEEVRSQIGDKNFVDVYSALQEHNQEDIYYRTDHHWTTLGAYYGYQQWALSMNKIPRLYQMKNKEVVSDNFLGTLHSRINLPMEGDTIFYLPETTKKQVSITYDYAKKTSSYYEESYLDTKNQYGFFLDDNHAFVEIETGYHTGRTLFVIKDSYANCMIPLLAPHYENILVLDLRYFNGKLFDFMETCEPEYGMDVLVLYNCIHFMEDFQYYE